jgi:hypothetical protein
VPKSQDNFSPGQPWTRTPCTTIVYSTHVLKVKLFFQHIINNVKTQANLCPVEGRLYLKHENKDKNLITSYPIIAAYFYQPIFVGCTYTVHNSSTGPGSGPGLGPGSG